MLQVSLVGNKCERGGKRPRGKPRYRWESDIKDYDSGNGRSGQVDL